MSKGIHLNSQKEIEKWNKVHVEMINETGNPDLSRSGAFRLLMDKYLEGELGDTNDEK